MRLLEYEQSFLDKPLLEFTHPDPKTIAPEELAAKALHEMETHSITCLVVADQATLSTTLDEDKKHAQQFAAYQTRRGGLLQEPVWVFDFHAFLQEGGTFVTAGLVASIARIWDVFVSPCPTAHHVPPPASTPALLVHTHLGPSRRCH